jgi:hypothetical protein
MNLTCELLIEHQGRLVNYYSDSHPYQPK